MGQQGQQGQQGQRGFSAFVSYSHADKVAAQKLHRRLEGYRLPKHVAEQLAADTSSDDPVKLGQIFRDREDLPAAQDLSESVKAALQVSGALIVLCSPAAKASKWVAREIETFRRLHPDRPILAALLEGEPEEAFPEPLLQGCEPLAADLRKEGDGPRLGFLKIVAGIAGVPLDALVQRDAQRRMRRVMAITGGAITAMLAMAIMTFVAIQSRNEAQRQRAEAEGLVEYMLTDLRDELKTSVGKLAVMERVNRRALTYYEKQKNLSQLPAESLDRRARIIGAMGIDSDDQGNSDLALQRVEEWHRTTKALLEREPNNSRRLFSHAESVNRIALLNYTNGDKKKAVASFLRADQLLSQIPQNEFANPEWSKLSALVSGNLCASKMHVEGDKAVDMQSCRKAVAASRRLVQHLPANSHYQYDLVFHLTWLGEAYARSGDTRAARKHWNEASTRIEKLVRENPTSPHFRSQQMEIYAYLAGANSLEKEKLINRAIKIADELTAIDTNNHSLAEKRRKYIKMKGDL